MINWKYNPEDYGKIRPITPGQYRVRIEDAEEAVSKNTGKDMIKLTLKVSGYNQKVFHYIVFNTENQEAIERTNDNLGRIFDSFNIEPGNLNVLDWKGKVGAAEISNREDNQGNMQSNVKFFIKRNKQDSLPAWQEGTTRSNVNPKMVNPDDGNFPF